MKHFKNKDGDIFAFEADGSQDDLITQDMTPCGKPKPPPPAPQEMKRREVDQAIEKDSLAKTLRDMSSAEFDAWWAANVTDATQAITVLKRITRIVLRRCL